VSAARRLIIAVVVLLVVGGAVGGYFAMKHSNDVAHAKHVREARIARIEAGYQRNLALYHRDLATWTRKNDKYEGCKAATLEAFAAADDVRGVIASGGSRDDYLQPIQDLATAVHSASRQAADNLDCLLLIDKIDRADTKFSKATNIWLEWISGDNYTWINKPDDLPMDKQFTAGAGLLDDAEFALSDMKPGAKPKSPVRGGYYTPPADLFGSSS
jgi:hypothetical protein